MILKEIKIRFFTREQHPTETLNFSRGEQYVLDIFRQSIAATKSGMLVACLQFGVRANEVLDAMDRFQQTSLVELDKEHKFAEELGPFWKITDRGKLAIKRIRRNLGAFTGYVSIEIPVLDLKAS